MPPVASYPRRNTTVLPHYAASAHAPFATAHSHLKTTTAPLPPPSRHVTSAAFEATIIANRSITDSATQLSSYHIDNAALGSAAISEERAHHLRKIRRVQQQNAELSLEHELESKRRESERAAIQHEQDVQLARAIEAEEKERTNARIERARICAQSDEIRDLEAKLRMATINRERHVQLMDRQRNCAEEKQADADFESQNSRMRHNYEQREHAERLKAAQSSQEHAAVLAAQMEEKLKAKAAAYAQFLAEKAVVERVVAELNAQDEKKAQKRHDQQVELQASISAYLAQREAWRQNERRKAREELDRILAYQAEQDRRAQARINASNAKAARDDEIYAAISRELQRADQEREEMERMLEELHAEEREQTMMKEIEAQQARAAEMRRQMTRENEAAVALKAQRAEQARREQTELRARVLAQLEADRAFDNVSDAKRRVAKAKLRAEMEEMLSQKAAQFEHAQALEEAERQAEMKQRQRELEIIEQERERLLNQLAKKLQNYLPAGVFKNQQEYQRILGS